MSDSKSSSSASKSKQNPTSSKSKQDPRDSGFVAAEQSTEEQSKAAQTDFRMAAHASVRPNIAPLDIDGVQSANLSNKWKNWIRQYRLYVVGAGLEGEPDKRKVAILLSLIGQ